MVFRYLLGPLHVTLAPQKACPVARFNKVVSMLTCKFDGFGSIWNAFFSCFTEKVYLNVSFCFTFCAKL